jgi:N6-L-threonylcarbamoyladenine synthase
MDPTTDPARRPLVLGIESSCDDTACAFLDGAGRVLSSVVSSQLAAHRPYGGVVPEIASREHLRNWPQVSAAAAAAAERTLAEVDVIAATRGPGLVGSLLVGLSLGKALAYALERPFFAVHHLEGHLYSPFLREDEDAEPLPDRFTGLVVSGGHTVLVQVDEGGGIAPLGQSRDDAMGEAFDKIGKRLGLPFPGGPHVDRLAEEGRPERASFTVPRCKETLDLSYSGLKSQTLLALERLEGEGVVTRVGEDGALPPEVLDVLAGFRRAAVAQILDRLERLWTESPCELLAVSGGAAANRLLRRELESWAVERGVDLRLVPLRYAGDNAAMIAFAALVRERRGERDDPMSADATSRLPF